MRSLYAYSTDDLRPPSGADALDADDRRYLVDITDLADAVEPWALAETMPATGDDVQAGFAVEVGHVLSIGPVAATGHENRTVEILRPVSGRSGTP